MQHLNYWQFPGFENLYLEDSYILDIKTAPSVEILVESVLTENHPLYTKPLPGEQYCYQRLKIQFPQTRTHEWVRPKLIPITDPNGSVDYGNIDEFFLLDGQYYLRGEWGELRIISEPPVIVVDVPVLK